MRMRMRTARLFGSLPLQLLWLLLLLLDATQATYYVRKGKSTDNVNAQPTLNSAFPRTGDLLIGRASGLFASSTCGDNQIRTQYCEMDPLNPSNPRVNYCGFCEVLDDNRDHEDRSILQPIIENVVNNMKSLVIPYDENRWYQSKPGQHFVTITIDLGNPFIVTHVFMLFKTWAPKSMYIERSNDYGKTWKMHRYFSAVCPSNMTNRPVASRPLDTVYCDNRQSKRQFEQQNRALEYKVLPPSTKPYDPFSPEVENLLRITSLRIVFTELNTYGDEIYDPTQNAKYYYALYAMRVSGTCFCHGHATSCKPGPYDDTRLEKMIYSWCNCRSGTAGSNCERCDDLNNDSPWKPGRLAHDGRDFANSNDTFCKPCECNNHAAFCRFNATLYAQSGNQSGGVCECMHNTVGRYCERCAPGYYFNENRGVEYTDPNACENCYCSLWGTVLDESSLPICYQTGPLAGSCNCKQNVEGRGCDTCKTGYYDLKQSNPLGCTECSCFLRGTLGNDGCDKQTGLCRCKTNVRGDRCDQCRPGFYNVSSESEEGCQACDCDAGGSVNNLCDPVSGQCECKESMEGRKCDRPRRGYFLRKLDHVTLEAEEMRTTVSKVLIDSWNWSYAKNWSGVGILSLKPGQEEVLLTSSIDGRSALPELDGRSFRLQYNPLVRFVLPAKYDGPPSTLQLRVALKTKSRRSTCPTEQEASLSLTSGQYEKIEMTNSLTYYVLIQSDIEFCLDTQQYTVEVGLSLADDQETDENFSVGLDNVALVPTADTLVAAIGEQDPEAPTLDVSQLQGDCRNIWTWTQTQTATPATIESSPSALFDQLPEKCRALAVSLSAALYGRAYPCACNTLGSGGSDCFRYGGQCNCRQNVIGINCDTCMPRAFGFGADGCSMCECHLNGSTNDTCNEDNGQCTCRTGAYGRACSRCADGFFGFPRCRPCSCNGRARTCDDSGRCIDCSDNTGGRNCQDCKSGYFPYGTRSERSCRECRCPGGNSTGIQHGYTCVTIDEYDYRCNCLPGYTGKTCSVCAKNYFGNPGVPGGTCRPCECSGNIDLAADGNCDPLSGRCLKCMHNTVGDSCERCKPGYFGNAADVSKCSRCDCDLSGSLVVDGTTCDAITGDCICKPNVLGRRCDICASGFYNISNPDGCLSCECSPQGSLSQTCNSLSGACQCKDGFAGPKCDRCPFKTYGVPGRCRQCQCDEEGSASEQCNELGVCVCKPGRTGRRCNECAANAIMRGSRCDWCGQCYDDWNSVVAKLAENVSRVVGERQPGDDEDRRDLPVGPLFDDRMKQFEREIVKLEDSCDRVNRTIASINDVRNRVGGDYDVIDGRIGQVTNDVQSATRELRSIDGGLASAKNSQETSASRLLGMDGRLRSIGQKTDVGTQQLIGNSNLTALSSFNEIQQLLQRLNSWAAQLSASLRTQMTERDRIRALETQTGFMAEELNSIDSTVREINRLYCGVGTIEECRTCKTLYCESNDEVCLQCNSSLDSRTGSISAEARQLREEIDRITKSLRTLTKVIETWQNDRRFTSLQGNTTAWLFTLQQLESRTGAFNSTLTDLLMRYNAIDGYLNLDGEVATKLIALRNRILNSNKTFEWSQVQRIQAQLMPLYNSIGNVTALLNSPTVSRKITEVRQLIATIRPKLDALRRDLGLMTRTLVVSQQLLQNINPEDLDGAYDRLMKLVMRLNGTFASLQTLNDILPVLIADSDQNLRWTQQTLVEIRRALQQLSSATNNCQSVQDLNRRVEAAKNEMYRSTAAAAGSDAARAIRVMELLDSIRQQQSKFDEKLGEIQNNKNSISDTISKIKRLERDLGQLEDRADRAVFDYNACIASIRSSITVS